MPDDTTPRVWGWKCPGAGEDPEPMTTSYKVWFWLYVKNQRMRHRLGLHEKQRHFSIAPRCDWCGKGKIVR